MGVACSHSASARGTSRGGAQHEAGDLRRGGRARGRAHRSRAGLPDDRPGRLPVARCRALSRRDRAHGAAPARAHAAVLRRGGAHRCAQPAAFRGSRLLGQHGRLLRPAQQLSERGHRPQNRHSDHAVDPVHGGRAARRPAARGGFISGPFPGARAGARRRAGARSVCRRRAAVGSRAARAAEAGDSRGRGLRRSGGRAAARPVPRGREQTADPVALAAQPEGHLPRDRQARAPARSPQPHAGRDPRCAQRIARSRLRLPAPRMLAPRAQGSDRVLRARAGCARSGRGARQDDGALRALCAPELGNTIGAFQFSRRGRNMKRRSFLKKAAAGLAAGSVAAPAIAQSQPAVTWRMATSWPKSLDTLFGGAELVAQRVGELTEGKFQIRAFAAGEIVPALQVLDAVQAGTVEIGHTAPYYYFGKDPAFALGTAVCFGMNTRQQNAWWYFGGGSEAMAPLFKEYGCIALLAGNTGCQMGGWFRKEIKSVADLKGLKFRIGGMAGLILPKLGVVPQLIGGAGHHSAAQERNHHPPPMVRAPHDEETRVNQVAQHYYY